MIYIYLQHQGIQNFSRWLEQQKKHSLLEKNVLDGEKHRLALMPFTAPPAACASSRLWYDTLSWNKTINLSDFRPWISLPWTKMPNKWTYQSCTVETTISSSWTSWGPFWGCSEATCCPLYAGGPSIWFQNCALGTFRFWCGARSCC